MASRATLVIMSDGIDALNHEITRYAKQRPGAVQSYFEDHHMTILAQWLLKAPFVPGKGSAVS
jgi:hypothetical protein